jgi:hypothetical protein
MVERGVEKVARYFGTHMRPVGFGQRVRTYDRVKAEVNENSDLVVILGGMTKLLQPWMLSLISHSGSVSSALQPVDDNHVAFTFSRNCGEKFLSYWNFQSSGHQ